MSTTHLQLPGTRHAAWRAACCAPGAAPRGACPHRPPADSAAGCHTWGAWGPAAGVAGDPPWQPDPGPAAPAPASHLMEAALVSMLTSYASPLGRAAGCCMLLLLSASGGIFQSSLPEKRHVWLLTQHRLRYSTKWQCRASLIGLDFFPAVLRCSDAGAIAIA